MRIRFHLAWLKLGQPSRKAFKLISANSLVEEFKKRISHFASCEIVGGIPSKSRGAKVWVCEREAAKKLSSEELASELEKLMGQGTKELRIVIGGADGFSEKDLEAMKPDLKWSFGPLTLPHELAAVVACEQIYRAWTIIRKHPYHSGHH